MNWELIHIEDERDAIFLSEELGVNAPFPMPLARYLVSQGITSFDEARTYFNPSRTQLHDALHMPDIDRATERILQAVQRDERILLYGDYDVDGATSVALMMSFFRDWSLPCEYYIPDRDKEGYGLSYEGIEYASTSGVNLIIALDCGTKAIEKSRLIAARGMELIICDHHTPGETLPVCHALLNPRRADSLYPFPDLSACGIALKLCEALAIELERAGIPAPWPGYDVLDAYVDFAALSTACDLVPMRGENRVITALGIEKLRKAPQRGLAELMALAERERSWEVEDLVFFLGPRINSAGRLRHAKEAVKVLLGEAEDLPGLAQNLHAHNAERKNLDAAITEDALLRIEAEPKGRFSTVLYDASWHKGVIGIVASRLIERHYRPTILFTESNGKWVGSGRSIEGFDLYEALLACEAHLIQFGGHKYAAGMTIEKDHIEDFREAFEAYAAKHLRQADLVPRLEIAGEAEFSYINPKFVRLIKRLSPFGPEHMEPVFVARNVVVGEYRILKEEHLRLNVSQGRAAFEAIGFGLARKWNEIGSDRLDIAFQPDFKTWNGRTYIQLKIKDIRPTR